MAGASDSKFSRSGAYYKHSKHDSIRQDVFAELEENSSLTARPLAKILSLEWPRYRNYLNQLVSQWRANYQNQLGLNRCVPDEVHRCFFGLVVPVGLDRGLALGRGWLATRARNRFLLWRAAGLGRMRWFENGNVELYVRKPATDARVLRLFCLGFTWNGLIVDADVIKRCVDSLRVKGGKATWYTGQHLPYLRIPLFKDSNGLEFLMGDKSDPTGVHVIFRYQEQMQKLDQFLEAFQNMLGLQEGQSNGGGARKGPDYVS